MATENVSILVTHDKATIFYDEEDFFSWGKAKYGKDVLLSKPKSYPCAIAGNELKKVHSITPWYKGDFIYDFES
jgi:hypothetical protein